MNQEEVSVDNEPMTLTYDDLLNVELKLVNVPDLYKYNKQYNTYEDMSEKVNVAPEKKSVLKNLILQLVDRKK